MRPPGSVEQVSLSDTTPDEGLGGQQQCPRCSAFSTPTNPARGPGSRMFRAPEVFLRITVYRGEGHAHDKNVSCNIVLLPSSRHRGVLLLISDVLPHHLVPCNSAPSRTPSTEYPRSLHRYRNDFQVECRTDHIRTARGFLSSTIT